MAPALITPHGNGSVPHQAWSGDPSLVPAVLGMWAGGGEGPGALWATSGLSCDISDEIFSPTAWGAGVVAAVLLL